MGIAVYRTFTSGSGSVMRTDEVERGANRPTLPTLFGIANLVHVECWSLKCRVEVFSIIRQKCIVGVPLHAFTLLLCAYSTSPWFCVLNSV